LRAAEQIEQEYQTWVAQHRLALTTQDREALLTLAADFAELWRAPTTTMAERKQLMRLVIKDVILDAKRLTGEVWMQVNWQTGATSEHHFPRNVVTYSEYSRLEALQRRLKELHEANQTDEEIAATLNAEGFVTARGRAFRVDTVRELRRFWKIPAARPRSIPDRWEDGAYSVPGVAATLGISVPRVRSWLKRGRLKGEQDAKGSYWKIRLTKSQIAKLKALV
jgi:hypothetical protein